MRSSQALGLSIGKRRAAPAAMPVVLCALAAILACNRESPAEAPAAPPAVRVGADNVVTVSMQEISTGPLISGTLMAQREATVRAEVSGSILHISAAEGRAVRRGELIARIEDQALSDARGSAQTAVRSAEQGLELAEREAARTETLVRGGALADRELDTARNAVATARAQLAEARSRLAAAETQLGKLTIRAPIDGIVASP